MEIWDAYDMERHKKHKDMVRGEPHQSGDYHLIILICIFNSEGKMLIQKRSSNQIGWPDLWDITVGGCAVKGENSRTAAARELAEELGIQMDFTNIRPHFTADLTDGFDDIFLIQKDLEISSLKLQKEEVQAVQWASMEEILNLIEKKQFISYYPEIIRLFFKARNQYGLIDPN